MHGKKGQHTDKRNTIVVKGRRYKVSPEVYTAYYKEYERARYVDKLDDEAEVYSLERFADEGVPVEYRYAMTRPSLEDEYIRRQMIIDALAVLNQAERELVDALYWEDKTESEIAKNLGITQQAVNRRLKRAIHKIEQFVNN